MKLDDIDDIIKETVSKTVQQFRKKHDMCEAYVAQPKQYNITTDFVSQKNIEFHKKYYKEAIDNLNVVSSKLDAIDTSNVSEFNSEFLDLKNQESKLLNCVKLHEAYFANCFNPSSEIYANSKAYIRLQRDFGSFDEWQREFLACAMSISNGWVVCGYNTYLKRYVNTVIKGDDCNVMIGLIPIIVLDIFEHAFVRDYTDNKRSYIVAQLKELDWDIIEDRFNVADTIAEIIP